MQALLSLSKAFNTNAARDKSSIARGTTGAV